MTSPDPTTLLPPEDAADWRSSVREGRYLQAEARLRARQLVQTLSEDDEGALEAVEGLIGWQKAVRARRYAQAQKCLAALAPLAGVLDLPALEQATRALVATEGKRIADEGELRAALEGAQGHPTAEAEALNQIGVLQALQGQPDAARETFQAALERDPEHHRALTNLGNLLLEAGNPHAAEEHYRRALTLEPDYAVAHNNLAAALRRQKRVNESVRAMKQSRRLENRRIQEDARSELRERLGAGGGLVDFFRSRTGQYVLIAVLVLLVYLLFLR